MVYICKKILNSLKKGENSAIEATWINLEIIMASEISKAQNDKHCWPHLRVESDL
jgi:hypothetical protein